MTKENETKARINFDSESSLTLRAGYIFCTEIPDPQYDYTTPLDSEEFIVSSDVGKIGKDGSVWLSRDPSEKVAELSNKPIEKWGQVRVNKIIYSQLYPYKYSIHPDYCNVTISFETFKELGRPEVINSLDVIVRSSEEK